MAEPTQKPKRNNDPRRAKVYLDRVLSLNPTTSARLMVDFRWRFCGLATASGTESKSLNPDQLTSRRTAVEKQLEKVRAHFWRAAPEKLSKSLEAIKASEFADLSAGVQRLQRLLQHRDAIEKLSSHPDREVNLYNTFRRIVMLSPRKAGEVKESYLRNFAYSESRKKVLAMIKMMRKEFPELVEIETDWFNQITRIKDRAKKSSGIANGISIELPIPGWMIGLVIFLLVRFLLRLIF